MRCGVAGHDVMRRGVTGHNVMCRVVTCSASRRRGSICPSPPRVGSRCRAAARMPGGYFPCPPACFHAWLFRNFRLRRWSEPGSVRGGRRSSGILRKGVARGPPQGGRPGSRRTDRESGVRLSAIPVPVGHRSTSKRNPPRGRRASSRPAFSGDGNRRPVPQRRRGKVVPGAASPAERSRGGRTAPNGGRGLFPREARAVESPGRARAGGDPRQSWRRRSGAARVVIPGRRQQVARAEAASRQEPGNALGAGRFNFQTSGGHAETPGSAVADGASPPGGAHGPPQPEGRAE